jgi:hypothetical protein
MLTEGTETSISDDSPSDMKLPKWADEKRIKM